MERKDAHPVTKTICGPYFEAIELLATQVGQSRGVVIRSMIAEWFTKYGQSLPEDIQETLPKRNDT